MLPLSRAELLPVPGKARTRPEDTLLSEVLLNFPDGGDHFWLKVQTAGLGHRQIVAAVARAARVEESHVASAGSRDRHAVVQQWLTVPKNLVDNPGQLKGAGYKKQLKVLEVREGAGAITAEQVTALNCRVRIQGGGAEDGYERAQAILTQLRQNGVPNYFGGHSMGPSGSHARWGKVLAQGKRVPNRVPSAARDRMMYERAWQARLFNSWVANRLENHGLGTVVSGDWLQLRANEAPHLRPVEAVEDVAAAQKRVDTWESNVLGPLWGDGCQAATGDALAIEQGVLTNYGPGPSQRCRGGHRTLRFQPKAAAIEKSAQDLLVQCVIPVDAFASVLAEEFILSQGHLP